MAKQRQQKEGASAEVAKAPRGQKAHQESAPAEKPELAKEAPEESADVAKASADLPSEIEVMAVLPNGFRRFGYHFGKKFIKIPLADLDDAKLAELERLAEMKILIIRR